MRTAQLFLFPLLLSLLLPACQTDNPLAAPTNTPAPPTQTPLPSATPTPAPDTIAGFDQFLGQVEATRPDQRQELVNRYVGGLAQAPITGGDEAIFLYSGPAQSVQVHGDMNNWNLSRAQPMTRLEGTDLWLWRASFEEDARLDYRFVVNSRDTGLDPLNQSSVPGPGGPNSELRMPGYHRPPELDPPAGQIPSGTISFHTLDSQLLGQTRTFQVYEPPGQIVGQALPTLYVNDGSDYLSLIDMPAILDRLIAARQIPPLLAVFITPINADQDYSLNDAYAGFLAEELAPYIRETFGASADPAATGVLGHSLGGLAAVHAAITYPEVFGLAISQSGRLGLSGDALVRRIGRGLAGSSAPQFYLVAGSYETAVQVNGQTENVLQANRRMAEALNRIGYDATLDERPEGHSWGLWRGTLGQALSTLFDSTP